MTSCDDTTDESAWVAPQRVPAPIATRAAIVAILIALVTLELFAVPSAQGTFSMAPALPACSGQVLAEGFTYRFRDPRRGEIVIFHARGRLGAPIFPDANSRDLAIDKRLIGLPGDTVVGSGTRPGRWAESRDIPTSPFPPVRLRQGQYFVLGDNRSVSQDSRDFSPVLRGAIFARVFLVVWPLDRFGVPGYDTNQVPLGTRCTPGP